MGIGGMNGRAGVQDPLDALCVDTGRSAIHIEAGSAGVIAREADLKDSTMILRQQQRMMQRKVGQTAGRCAKNL